MFTYAQLLKKRRSVRHFEEKDVSMAMVREMIEECCLAPSAGNRQPWQFVIIKDRETIKKLSDESKANFLAELEKHPDTPIKQYEAVLRIDDFNVFYNAPCLILIAGDPSVRTLQVDCALAAAYFMFAATSRGLGTCWVDLGGNIKHPETLVRIGLNETSRIVAPIILGYPTMVPEAPPRNAPRILRTITS